MFRLEFVYAQRQTVSIKNVCVALKAMWLS